MGGRRRRRPESIRVEGLSFISALSRRWVCRMTDGATVGSATPRTPADHLGPSKALLHDAGAILSGVADADLDAGVTRRMLTAIYRLSVPLILVPPFAGVAAFVWFEGLDWRLAPVVVVAIAAGAVLLVGLRLILGFALMLLRFLDQLTQLPAAVLSLNSEVEQLRDGVVNLRGGVAELRDDVAPLSGVVQGLTGHVDSLQGSLDGVQFWRAPSRLWKAASERPLSGK